MVFSVADYLALVNASLAKMAGDAQVIEGEVSDFRVAQGKWVSFDLKDPKAQAVLKCFMTVWQLKVPLEDGMQVQIVGFPKIYERFGTFKMNVQSVELVGEGALMRAYVLLKAKLEAEGLFDPVRKRSLPRFVQRIGLITSRDAAAYGDFVRILSNRWGGVEIDFYHVHVQGREAVSDIVEAFAYFNTQAQVPPDVLVLTRGGGGIEDLHAFNDEAVARAVYASRIPVVVGVGHERDESLADYVADARASTPSNAAERIVPRREDVLYEIDTLIRHMYERLIDAFHEDSRLVDDFMRLAEGLLEQQEQARLACVERLRQQMERVFVGKVQRTESLTRVLEAHDPNRPLAIGYSLVFRGKELVRRADQLDRGQEIRVQCGNGSIEAEVLRLNGQGPQRLL